MLPEELSADICSLKEGKVRAAMACHLKISKEGELKSWRFTRAKICVAANIAYEDAQAAIDSAQEETVDVSLPVCFMPPIEGRVPADLVEKALSRELEFQYLDDADIVEVEGAFDDGRVTHISRPQVAA